MFGLRVPEMIIILVVMLLVFGPKKLPQLGESLGKGIRAFKHASEHGIAGDEGAAAQAQLKEASEAPAPQPAASKSNGVRVA